MPHPRRNLSPTGVTIGLNEGPQSERLRLELLDLITQAYKAFTNRPGKSLSLTVLRLVYEENNEGKVSTHFVVRIKDQDHVGTTPMSLSFTAAKLSEGDMECLANF